MNLILKSSYFLIFFFVLNPAGDSSLFTKALADISPVYTVANFPIRAVDKNAVQAKKKAMSEGEVEAFRLLIKRLTNYSNYSRIPDLSGSVASSMLNGISVRQERNSRTEYVAVFDFNFAPERVRQFLRKAAIPFTDVQARKTTVLPIYMASEKISQSEQQNWQSAWNKLDLKHSLTPVQMGRPTPDVTPEILTAILAGDGQAFSRLADSYGANQLILVVASKAPDSGKLNIRMIGRDTVGAFDLDRSYLIFNNKPGSALDAAAKISLGIMEGRWKTLRIKDGPEALIPETANEQINLIVQFSGLREWQNIRSELSQVSGVENLDVDSISARGAQVSLNFPGGPNRLSQVLLNHNFSLNNVGGNWILRKF